MDDAAQRRGRQSRFDRGVEMKSATLLAILAIDLLLACRLAGAQTLTLGKTSYSAGEPIQVIWSGSEGPEDRIGIFRDCFAPSNGVSNHAPDIWEHAVAAFGGITFTTPLPTGDYVAHLIQGEGPNVLTDGVPFTVTHGTDMKGGIGHRVLIGPGSPGGHLADPQVIKEGSTYYITGTCSGAGGYIYSTDDFQEIAATWMEIDTKPWPYPYQHIWAFEIYKHTDGTWHAYGFDFDRGGLYHFVPDPDPTTTTFPVLRWKEKELLLPGDYDNRVIHDGTDMYLLTAKGNAGHISVYCHRMLDPATLDPDYTPHRIMSEEGDNLESERRNAVGAMKIHECPFIIRASAAGGEKCVMSYTVGDYGIRDYKIGFAYSDVLIPPPGTEYTKATKPDAQNVWGTGAGADEVVYVTQTQKPSWPNYHASRFNRPGSGDIIEYEGNYFMVYHAAVPLQMEGMVGTRGYDPGRMTWIMPVTFDFTGSIDTWATPGLPAKAPEEPSIWPSRTTYAPDEDIVIHFRNAGQSQWDWVGLFRDGERNENHLKRTNLHGGTEGVPDVWAWERTNYSFSGSVTFAGRLSAAGEYGARLFYCGGSNPAAAKCAFGVTAAPNLPPSWPGDAIAAPDGVANGEYSHSLAGLVTDPEGDPPSYSLVSSPTWLRVAADGDLSGTPPAEFVGLNTFTVGVTDGNGDVVAATLGIKILPQPR